MRSSTWRTSSSIGRRQGFGAPANWTIRIAFVVAIFLEAVDDLEIGAIKNSVGVAEAFASGRLLANSSLARGVRFFAYGFFGTGLVIMFVDGC
jgi:hypothetical protein